MSQLPVYPLHEGPDTLRRALALGELEEPCVKLRRVLLLEGRQRRVELPHRSGILSPAEQNVEILRVPDCFFPLGA